jgi:hypothetical protein
VPNPNIQEVQFRFAENKPEISNGTRHFNEHLLSRNKTVTTISVLRFTQRLTIVALKGWNSSNIWEHP